MRETVLVCREMDREELEAVVQALDEVINGVVVSERIGQTIAVRGFFKDRLDLHIRFYGGQNDE